MSVRLIYQHVTVATLNYMAFFNAYMHMKQLPVYIYVGLRSGVGP